MLSLRNQTAAVRMEHVHGVTISDAGGSRQICMHIAHSVPMHIAYERTDDGRRLAEDDFDRIMSAMVEEF